jgi:hypothetical protein
LFALLILGLSGGVYASTTPSPGQAAAAAPEQAWHIEIVDVGAGRSPSLALDALGQPSVAYFGPHGTTHYGLLFARYENFQWAIEVVDDNGSDYASLALDALGDPHISYYGSSSQDLKYAHHYNGSWHIQNVDTTGDVGQYTSIAVDSAGRPYISYWDDTNQAVKCARRIGTSWQIDTIEVVGGYGEVTSLALDSADQPHISYHSELQDALKLAYYDGSSWYTEVVDDQGYSTGEQSSLAFDSQDRPHISYTSHRLMYAHHDGSQWHTTVLHDSHLAGNYNSLALDQSDRPHISYTFWNYPDETWLIHRYFDGVDWQWETVDIGGGASAYMGTSLAMDQADYPHIAYWAHSADVLKYAVYRDPCTPVTGVNIDGWGRLPLGVEGDYSAAHTPPEATPPIVYAWDNGALAATAAYSWTTVGNYSIEVTATNLCGQVQDTFPVEVFCQPVEGASIKGPQVLLVDRARTYLVSTVPITASRPLSFAWDNGSIGSSAIYSWPATGTYTLTVTATNVCGGVRKASLQVQVLEEWPYNTFLPLVTRGQ